MDSGAELQKLLDAIKRNPNLDEDRLHTILHKLKTLKETFDKLGDSELPGDQIAKLIDAETSTGKSLTWQPTFYEYIVFFIVLAFIILIFVFFGYKLYKSLTERQRKREEKQKAKQLKAKKK